MDMPSHVHHYVSRMVKKTLKSLELRNCHMRTSTAACVLLDVRQA